MFSDSDFGNKSSQRAGPSQITFNLLTGTTIPLTAEGMLSAMFALGTSVVTDQRASIELPWRLLSSITAQTNGEFVVAEHSARPVTSETKITGLWRTNMRAADGDARDAKLLLVPTEVLPPGEMDPPTTLTRNQRLRIVDLTSRRGPPSMRKLELSTLGASFAVTRSWPELEWEHESVVGRDQHVRVTERGFLYPFGHRAEFMELTQRTFGPLRQPELSPSLRGTHGSGSSGSGGSGSGGSGASSGPGGHPPENPPGGGPSDPEPDDPQPPPPAPPRAIAGLYAQRTLSVSEPIRAAVADERLARQFPFDQVELLTLKISGFRDPGGGKFFTPTRLNGEPVMFSLRCSGSQGDVHLTMPLIFVSDASASEEELAEAFEKHGNIKVPGLAINVLRTRIRQASDVFEVHGLNISGFKNAGAFAPRLSHFVAELPALRTLLPDNAEPVALAYTKNFLSGGDSVDLALEPIDAVRSTVFNRILKPINIDFTNRPDRSGGLVSPKFFADTISRSIGPTPAAALAGAPDLATIYKGATLLGLPLGSLIKIDDAKGAPVPTIITTPGQPPTIEMKWNLRLKSLPPFRANAATALELTSKIGGTPPESTIKCTVQDFDFVLPPNGPPLLELNFGRLVFSQLSGRPPSLDLEGLKLKFDGLLKLVQELAKALEPLLGTNVPTVKPAPSGISVFYTLGVKELSAGAFLMRNIAIRVGVEVPFSPKPVIVSLGFASREDPFNLSVLMFGGGGYIDVRFGSSGLTGLEASMEFGAMVAVSFVIAKGEVHALGGVRLFLSDGKIALDAFIRIGGSVQVLGLVSVSIELVVLLGYREDTNRLIGSAKLVITIDVTLYAGSVTIDSGEWVLIGSDRSIAPPVFIKDQMLAGMRAYREAFAA